VTVSDQMCAARGWLSSLPRPVGGMLALLMSAAASALGAMMIFAIDSALGYGLVPPDVQMARSVPGASAMSVLIVAVVLRYLYAVDRWQAQVQAAARAQADALQARLRPPFPRNSINPIAGAPPRRPAVAERAQADALQARIRPHFLFNSMNTIAGVLRRDPAVAERAVLDLSDLFRAALGAGEGDSTLAEEITLAERYLGIEQLRLGDRLQVEWQRGEGLPMDLPLPRLVLQPLVENAVLHGVSRLSAGGSVRIRLEVAGDELRLQVRNPAPPPPLPGGPARRAGDGAGHAQQSIGHRLAFAYPGARMTSGWDEAGGQGYYLVEVRVPLGR